MSTATDLADALDGIIGKSSDHLGIQGYLDTGIPELNHALSGQYDGGIASGRCIEIFGPASCGKTFLATMIMRAAQEAGGIAFFADHERSFEPVLAKSLGLNVDDNSKFRHLKPKTFEESLEKAVFAAEHIRNNKLIPDEAPLVWVFDSVASMIPRSKLYDANGKRKELGTHNMNDSTALARATSQNYPTLAQWAEDYNMTVLLLNQIRTKPGVMYGDPTTTPGGQAAEFYASIRLSIGKSEITNGKKGKDKEVLGFSVTAKTIKNKVARPFMSASWQVRFAEAGKGVNVDEIATNLDFMVRKGIIKKEGTRVVWEGKKMFQSVLEKELKSDPEGAKKLRDLLGRVIDASDGEAIKDVQEGLTGTLDDLDKIL